MTKPYEKPVVVKTVDVSKMPFTEALLAGDTCDNCGNGHESDSACTECIKERIAAFKQQLASVQGKLDELLATTSPPLTYRRRAEAAERELADALAPITAMLTAEQRDRHGLDAEIPGPVPGAPGSARPPALIVTRLCNALANAEEDLARSATALATMEVERNTTQEDMAVLSVFLTQVFPDASPYGNTIEAKTKAACEELLQLRKPELPTPRMLACLRGEHTSDGGLFPVPHEGTRRYLIGVCVHCQMLFNPRGA